MEGKSLPVFLSLEAEMRATISVGRIADSFLQELFRASGCVEAVVAVLVSAKLPCCL